MIEQCAVLWFVAHSLLAPHIELFKHSVVDAVHFVLSEERDQIVVDGDFVFFETDLAFALRCVVVHLSHG